MTRGLIKTFSGKSLSQKILIGLGTFFVLLAIAVGLLISYMTSAGNELDISSKEFVDTSVPRISKSWNAKDIKELSSREFMNSTDTVELENFFKYCNEKLGKMKHYRGSQGESRIFINNFKLDITAVYTAQVDFEKGKATVDVSLVRENNKWYILGYKVNSEIFQPY